MNRFARRPLTLALALALAASGQQLHAADVVILTPPGGNLAVRDSTAALLRLLVNGTNGEVTIPFLTTAPRMKERGFRFRNPIRDEPKFRYVMVNGPDDLLMEVFQCLEPGRWRVRREGDSHDG